jgi:Zn-dependent protease
MSKMTGGVALVSESSPVGGRFWSPVTDEERALLEVVGTSGGGVRVLVRRPCTIAWGRHAYLPCLAGAAIAFGVSYRHGALPAAVAGGLSAFVLTAALLAHELGHLLFARRSRGVRPRMLVLLPRGGLTVVEGRHEDPAGAALFAAGGPLASIATVPPLVAAGLMLPGPFASTLLVPAVLTACLALVNLLPVAPMDGWLLLRSALWAKHGSRSEGERRALRWSRCLLVWGLPVVSILLITNRAAGIAAIFAWSMFIVQHHEVHTRLDATARPAGRR